MQEIINKDLKGTGMEEDELKSLLMHSLMDERDTLKKILLIPPDITRSNSGAGKITAIYYEMLKDTCEIHIMPALGTHMPMNREEIIEMFGTKIPLECFKIHNWRDDVIKIGEIPASFVKEISQGLMYQSIDVEVNKLLLDTSYDLIISIGQVVPHEVVGMANYSKNIFVGCGGSTMINQTHMLGAFYGMERIMGKDHTPVRKVFDYAETHFIKQMPLLYVLTVTTQIMEKTCIHGLFIGRNRNLFEEAVALSQEKNLTYVEKPLKKVVVFLDDKEFKSTWLGNKAIYRTRMAIADDGELIVLAPGVKQFGEDPENDLLIRKYGYVGREQVLDLCNKEKDLQGNLSVAAHLIHGSSDERFRITYAVQKLTREEVEGVNFNYLSYEEVCKQYDIQNLKDGINLLENGEEIFYISNPALGLWIEQSRLLTKRGVC